MKEMVEDWNQDFQILLIEHADESFWTGDNKLEYFTTKANFDGDNALVPFHVIKKRNMKITIDSIEKMIVHHVGNKSNGEGVGFSEKNVNLEGIEQDIKKLLRKSFEMDDLFRFYFESTIDLNPIYSFCKTIFNDNDSFIAQSKHIAKILYESSNHPKIKSGDVSILYLKGCTVGDNTCDAIGILKSETKQEILQIERCSDGFTAKKTEGISLSKIDKGCIIFNINESEGYQVTVIDKTSRMGDTKYWKDSFLHVKSYNGAYHQTKSLVDVCKDFINTEVSGNKGLTKVEKAMIAVRAKKALLENEILTLEQYTEEVFQDTKLIGKFNDYILKNGFENHIQNSGNVTIERKAIKKAKTKVETIKLDENFDISIHGGEYQIERGYDENAGMNYYKLFFKKKGRKKDRFIV